MKKILVMLVALIGFGISNYCQAQTKVFNNGCYIVLKSTGNYWLYDANFKDTGVTGKGSCQ